MKTYFKISIFELGKKHFYLIALIIAIIMFFMASGAAINIDEILHYNHAKKVVNWFVTFGKDTSCLITPASNLKYYGQSVDNISALINWVFSIENEYQTRHYIGFVFSFLLVLVTGLVAFEISGSYFIGTLALILMVISPRLVGQAYGNLKDIPFAMGYMWALLMTIKVLKELPKPGWRNIIILGLAIAFTNSVRIGGLLFFPYLALFFIIWVVMYYRKYEAALKRQRFWKSILLKGFVIVFVGYFVGLVFWPYALINLLKNPVQSLMVMEHYKISIKQIFEGTQTWSTNLPWYYLPKWILISIPEIVIIGIALFIRSIYRFVIGKNTNALFLNGVVFFTFIFPLVYVIVINSNLYSGWRQMYFLYGPLIVLSSVGLGGLLMQLKKWKLVLSTGVLLILILMPVIHIIKTYPSEYIYFNTVANIGEKPWSNYEYDYYWHEMKKAADWLKEDIKDLDKKITVASNFDITKYLYDNKNIEFDYVHFYDKISTKWDYAILGINYVHPYQLKNETWQPEGVLKTFFHKGNPTVIIIKGQDKNAYNGFVAFSNKNFALASNLLTLAHKNDSTDLNILAYLGESYLAQNNYLKVDETVVLGKKINPFYEPFLLLNAKSEIKQGNYKTGIEILRFLFQNNPRYVKALPYLIECYEKTGETETANRIREKFIINEKNISNEKN